MRGPIEVEAAEAVEMYAWVRHRMLRLPANGVGVEDRGEAAGTRRGEGAEA